MKPNPSAIAIVGTTTWGMTLGLILAGKGAAVRLWARTQEEAAALDRERENKARLPGFKFPDTLAVTASLEEALSAANLVILAVPSQHMRQNVRLAAEHLRKEHLVLSVAKGLELGTAKRMSQVIADEIDPRFHSKVCVLSGPNLAREIVRGLPATTVVAAYDTGVATRVQRIIASPLFRVYVNNDVVGVELGGVLKNVIALAAGMVDGLGLGDNTKAGLITRGLAEITRLGVAAGANPLTFAGLAGLGDLMATCSSPLSRNRYVGQELAKGRTLKELLASMTEVAEGVTATEAALKLAKDLDIEMPIAEEVYRVLYEGLDVRRAVSELMERKLKHEFAGILDDAIGR